MGLVCCCFFKNDVKPVIVSPTLTTRVMLSSNDHIKFLKEVGELRDGYYQEVDIKTKDDETRSGKK